MENIVKTGLYGLQCHKKGGNYQSLLSNPANMGRTLIPNFKGESSKSKKPQQVD